MRFQLISDLHTEFHRDNGDAMLKSFDPTDVDLLIVAGDFSSGHYIEPTMGALCAKYPHVAFVLGNHEFYKSDPRVTQERARAAVAKYTNLTWLDESVVEVAGKRIIGTTMWFPRDTGREQDRNGLNDFRLIRHFTDWVFMKNQLAQEFLRRELRAGDIVVTHHLPSPRCIHPKYAGSPINKYFVCDMEALITERQPRYWLFGHTHEQVRERIGNCELIANPFGYLGVEPEANRRFGERLVFEI